MKVYGGLIRVCDVKLTYKLRAGDGLADTGADKDIFGRSYRTEQEFELLINGKPLDGLIQSVGIAIDAESMLPTLTVKLIPSHLEVNLEAKSAVDLPALEEAIESLTADWERKFGKVSDPETKQRITEAVEKMHKANSRQAEVCVASD